MDGIQLTIGVDGVTVVIRQRQINFLLYRQLGELLITSPMIDKLSTMYLWQLVVILDSKGNTGSSENRIQLPRDLMEKVYGNVSIFSKLNLKPDSANLIFL